MAAVIPTKNEKEFLFFGRLNELDALFEDPNAPFTHCRVLHRTYRVDHFFCMVLLRKEKNGQKTSRMGSPGEDQAD